MKISRTIAYLLLSVCLLPSATAAEDTTLADSLMAETSFVLRGVMSKKWKGSVNFAVSDPVRNVGHKLEADGRGRFNMTVPMRGPLQQIYLYLGGTATVPVCAGDTINLIIEDDDMKLTVRDPKAQLDYQLAEEVHNKMRKRFIDINRTFNDYRQASGYGLKNTARSDSLLALLISKTDDYHARYKAVVDAFVASHGSPRLEEYFRVDGYYSPLRFVAIAGALDRVGSKGYISEKYPAENSTTFRSRFLKHPAYMSFTLNNLNFAVGSATRAFGLTPGEDSFRKSIDISRLISPDSFLEELNEVKSVDDAVRYSHDPNLRRNIAYVHENISTPALRKHLEGVMAGVERVAPGHPAPKLVMRDADGKRVSLEDLRGKYVYLDFWDFGCGACINEFRIMPQLHERFAGKMGNMEIITVCISDPSKDKLLKFTEKHGMNDRNLILDRKKSDDIYDFDSLPAYVLIDPQGRIAEFYTDRPSVILRRSSTTYPSAFEKALTPQ